MNLDDDTMDELPAPPRKEISAADLELLTLAARALGARFEEVDGEGYGNLHFEDGSVVHAWNSLEFSGDALELAVKLGIDIGKGIGNTRWACFWADSKVFKESGERADGQQDELGATRRAVTRAAAEIWRAKA